jgi:hypothetical protein
METTVTTATAPKITAESLANCFRAAREAAEAIDREEDGGTCNMDSPAFRLPRVPDKLIREAAELAGVSASDFLWFGRKRWYWLHVPLHGQGNRRSRMSHAATQALREAAEATCPQMQVCEYCQMD